MRLKTPDGQVAVVVSGSTPAVHDGWMWDLTVPGNNDHDFYVLPQKIGSSYHTHHVAEGDTPVLVHNADGCGVTVSPAYQDWATKGAHVHVGNSEVRIFPNVSGGIGAEAIRLRSGTASAADVQKALDAINSDPALRADLISKAQSAMDSMNAGEWGMNSNRAAEMHFLIKALQNMGGGG